VSRVMTAVVVSAWVPIEDERPADGIDVLGFFPNANTEIMITHAIAGDWYKQNVSLGDPIDVELTHWMELPSGPITYLIAAEGRAR